MTVLPIEQQAIRDRSKERQAEARKEWQTDPPTGPPDPKREAVRHTEPPDPVVATIGLPRHPPVDDLARELEEAARLLRSYGKTARTLAASLAGSPLRASGPGGGGGPFVLVENERGDEERVAVTSVEAAVIHGDKWAGIDRTLATAFAQLHHATETVHRTVSRIVERASDDDTTPAGTGACAACGIFVRPSGKRPEFRIRANLCPADYRAWVRAGKPDRGTWVRERRQLLTDPDNRRASKG